ncbi:MAG: aldo/keto reductase [Rhodothermales bacterium]
MIQIDFPGGTMPALGLGTWQLKDDEATEAVAHALDLGYRHIDTAQVYDNERAVGVGLRTADVDRDAVFLTTKVWRDKLKRRALIASTDDSLRRLDTDYVDLLLIHWPNEDVELAETLDALQEVQHRQRTRHIGVSNFPPALFREALAIAPDLVCDQVEYHPYLAQEPLLDVLRAHEMILTAYSPLARGEVFDESVVREIAETHGKSPAQVVLRWHLQQDRVAAIPKAASAAHRASNFDVFDFALSDDEMAQIHSLAREDGRMIDPDFAPDWDAA